jgi:protein CLEC16A
LDQQLSKTTKITEQNQEQMIETVRSIAELMVWGDQNDGAIIE